MELVFTRPEIGTFILLSGDSDFSSLVIKLKEYGKYVIGVGIRESSSDLLVMNCDEYYSYNALAGLVKNDEDESRSKCDPWELVTEAVSRMKRNGDVMRSDRLKQVMQEIDSYVRREGPRHGEVLALRAGSRAARSHSRDEARERTARDRHGRRRKGGREPARLDIAPKSLRARRSSAVARPPTTAHAADVAVAEVAEVAVASASRAPRARRRCGSAHGCGGALLAIARSTRERTSGGACARSESGGRAGDGRRAAHA